MPQWADFLPGHGASGGTNLLQSLNPLKATGSLLSGLTGSLNQLTGLAGQVLHTTVTNSFDAGRGLLDATLPGLSTPDQSRLIDTVSTTISQTATAPLGVASALLNPAGGNVTFPLGNVAAGVVGAARDVVNTTTQTIGNFVAGATPGTPLQGAGTGIQNVVNNVGANLQGTPGSPVASSVQNTATTVTSFGRDLLTSPPTTTPISVTPRGDIGLIYDSTRASAYFVAYAAPDHEAPHAEGELEQRTAPPPPEDPRRLDVEVELFEGMARFNLTDLERAAGRPLLLDLATLMRMPATREADGLVTAIAADRVPHPGEVPQGFVPQVKMRDDPFPYADVFTPSKPKEYVKSAADSEGQRAASLQDLLREAIRRFYAMRPPVGSIGDRLGFGSNGAFVQSLAHNEQQSIEIRVIRDQMRALGMQDARMERLLLLQEHLSDHALEYSVA